MNKAETIDALRLSEKELETANASMHAPIPPPLTINAARRPMRSMMRNPTNEDRNFHVRAQAARILEMLALRPRFVSKIMGM